MVEKQGISQSNLQSTTLPQSEVKTTVTQHVVSDQVYANAVGYDKSTLPPKGTTLTQPILHGNQGHDVTTTRSDVFTGTHWTQEPTYTDTKGFTHSGIGANVVHHSDELIGRDTGLVGTHQTIAPDSIGTATFDPNRNLTTTVPTTGTTTGLGTTTTTGTSVEKKVYVDSKGTPHHGLGAKIHEVKDKITHKHGTTTTGTTTGTGTGTRL